MSIFDQKKKIMGDIAALNVITEGLPKLKTTNSFSSMNNDKKPIDFLLDLVQSLIGYEELKENIVDLLTKKLPELETEIKETLKIELKGFVSCGINPMMPQFLSSNGQGVTIKVSEIDFFEILKTSPTSILGSLIYDDVNSGINSKDFNTFLYSNIELNKSITTVNGGTVSAWGASVSGSDILDLKFSPIGSTTNNIIKINANSNYNNKTLTDFNNAFIDSITLFGLPGEINGDKILNNIVDNLFGTIALEVPKTASQLTKEGEINEVLNCILDSDENDVIDDSYFEFSNQQLSKIQFNVNNRKNGIRIIETCGNLPTSIPLETLLSVNDTFTATTTTPNYIENKVKAMSDAIDTLSNAAASNSITINIPTIKWKFVLDLIKEFTKSIINIVLSPKLMTLFILNTKIIYGLASETPNAIEFMKKNKQLLIAISKLILEQILKMLLKLALKYIAKKLAKKYSDDTIEQYKNYANQILSLIGVPPEIIKEIQNLNYTTS